MDMASFEEHVRAFAEAHGRALFAADQAKRRIKAEYSKQLDLLHREKEKNEKIATNRIATDLETRAIHLQENLRAFESSSQDILQIAEYLEIGQLVSPSMVSLASSLRTVPFIIPLFGHANLVVLGNPPDLESLEIQIVWKILNGSAPGQIDLTIYNPSLRNNLSVFSSIPQYSVITTAKDFESFLSEISNEILSVDSLLKGHSSLVDLRKEAKQPVGNLRLVVLQEIDFWADEGLRHLFIKVINESPRAGIAFVCFSTKIDAQPIFAKSNSNTVVTYKKDKEWTVVSSGHTAVLDFQSNLRLDKQIAEYIDKANNSSVITIPFTSVEPMREVWQENSATGISFSMGKAGLETVSLKLGDSVTQCHNILISGAAGKGKSNLLEVIVHSLCTRYSPNELQLYLLDFKDGLTFKPYSEFSDHSYLPHARVLGLESERDFGLATLQYLEAERKRRADVYKRSGCSGILSYRQKNPEAVMPRIILMIDEYQKLFEVSDRLGTAAADLLENLVRQGRACGIHVILASQTIHGAAALMGREDKIYAQFPVRVALQNSLTESYATFVQGNDGAAKLRVRGEAIINENYGDINSNKRFTVAYADPAVMRQYRLSWCKEASPSLPLPVIFQKDEVCNLAGSIPAIKDWRGQINRGESYQRVPCGFSVSVDKRIISVRMSNDAGRHVALLGAGDDSQNPEPMTNVAIGMLECMSIALALQHINGDARFSFINCLDKQKYDRNGIENWLRAMERFGFPVEVISNEDASRFLNQVARQIEDNSYDADENHYIICTALDRCTTLGQKVKAKTTVGFGVSLEDPFARASQSGTGIDALQTILRNGSQVGIHILSWWTNVTIFKEHIGLRGDGYINTKIILRLDTQTMQKLLSNFSTQALDNNRALIHDDTDLPSDVIVVPYVPMSQRDIGIMEAEAWNL